MEKNTDFSLIHDCKGHMQYEASQTNMPLLLVSFRMDGGIKG